MDSDYDEMQGDWDEFPEETDGMDEEEWKEWWRLVMNK